jgi:23S rRNA pseudouridine1911/1915/1917 synthase
MERFQGYSRSFLQKLIKDGQVLVDGRPVKTSWHVSPSETIAVLLPPGRTYDAEEMKLQILYEDPCMIALSKPPNLIVHPARGHLYGTLYHGLLHHFRERIAADPSFHFGAVHRLDEETSGVILWAADPAANKELTRQFERRLVRKTYLLIVHGAPEWPERELDAAVGVDPKDRRRGAVEGVNARPAQTRFEVLARAAAGFALLRAHPRTGRSHQIRIHSQALGFPLVGDPLYGGCKDHPAFGGLRPRVALHSESLSLFHPLRGTPLLLRAPLPDDLRSLAAQLALPLPTEPAASTPPLEQP